MRNYGTGAGQIYEIVVLEVKPKDPSKAVSIVECDLELDFAPPVGYVEPERKSAAQKQVGLKKKPPLLV